MMNVLLLEDDIYIRDGLKRILLSIDNDVKIYETGSVKEALLYIEKAKMDVFILDIQLEDGDGISFAKKVREKSIYKLTQVVFITAILTREMIAFKEVHCYDYIIKPFNEDEVTETLKTIVIYGKNSDSTPKLEVNCKSYNYIVDQSDILFIEAKNKKVNVVTNNDSIQLSKISISKLLDNLCSDFLRCHRAFIVNKTKILLIDKSNQLIRVNGHTMEIPIGRKYKRELKERVNDIY